MISAATESPRLCADCAAKVTRAFAILCAMCAPKFKVLVLPDDVRTWEEIDRASEGDDGVAIDEYIKGLLTRVSNQQRELSRLNAQIAQLNQDIRRAHHGVKT